MKNEELIMCYASEKVILFLFGTPSHALMKSLYTNLVLIKLQHSHKLVFWRMHIK